MAERTTGAVSRITSRFDAESTALDVVAGHDLRGKSVIVTGGASGIGLETVRALASAGAAVTIAARTLPAAHRVAGTLNARFERPLVSAAELDIGDLSSVRRFCAEWGEKPLHILINNAGVMASPDGVTRDGFEVHFGTNHLGHFLLSVLLTPALKRGAPSRLITLSSSGHMRCAVDCHDPHFRRRPYDPVMAYAQSKTANALFAVEFNRRHAADGIQAYSVMPGMIETGILRHVTTDALARTFGLKSDTDRPPDLMTAPVAFRTAAQGAATTVWAAVAPELDGHGGLYLQDCAQAPPLVPDMPRGQGVHPHALDPDAARVLWDLSEREVGLS